MAGLLERILATSGNAGFMPTPSAGFPAVQRPLSPEEEWQKIQEEEAAARAAADRRNVAGMTRAPIVNPSAPTVPDAQSAGVQLALEQAPPGTGVPFSTQAGMLPPITLGQDPAETPIPPGQVPLPVARPNIEGDEVGARSRTSPVQIAPPAAPAVAPAVPQAGMGPGEPPSFLSRIASTLGDNSNTLLAMGAGFAGAPNWGQAISRGASAAIPARAADISQSLARAGRGTTTRALIEAGVPTQQAIAAQYDPDLKKSLIKQYLEDRAKKIVEIGQDPNTGAKIFGQHDPFSGKITPIDMTGFKSPGGDATGAATDITGPDYLERLKETDPAHARKVESIVNGDMPFPTGRQAQTPIGMRLVKDVLQVEPGATQQDFANRGATSKAYSSGIESRVTRSVNTTLKHAATLEKAINDLDNFSTLPGVLNPIRGVVAGQTSPAYQKALGAYQTAVGNFAKELDFVVSGGRPTVSGTKHQMEGFDPNAAKVLQLEKLRTGIDLLKGRLDSHAEGFAKGMKRRADPTDFIDPPNRKLYERLIGGEDATPGVAAPKAAAPAPKAPAPGTYVWDPATMRLVPAK